MSKGGLSSKIRWRALVKFHDTISSVRSAAVGAVHPSISGSLPERAGPNMVLEAAAAYSSGVGSSPNGVAMLAGPYPFHGFGTGCDRNVPTSLSNSPRLRRRGLVKPDLVAEHLIQAPQEHPPDHDPGDLLAALPTRPRIGRPVTRDLLQPGRRLDDQVTDVAVGSGI